MPSTAFIDTNIPIYAAGDEHPLKAPSAEILALVAEHPDRFASSVEVLQELLHRYLAIRRWDAGREVVRYFAELMTGRVEAFLLADIHTAVALAEESPDLSARDLVHAAVMKRVGITRIISADRGFDTVEAIERLDPARMSSWIDSVLAD